MSSAAISPSFSCGWAMVVIPIGLLWPISELSYPVTVFFLILGGGSPAGERGSFAVLGGDVAFIFEKSEGLSDGVA